MGYLAATRKGDGSMDRGKRAGAGSGARWVAGLAALGMTWVLCAGLATAQTPAPQAAYQADLTASQKVAAKTSVALCGFPLKACPPATVGHVLSVQPKAGSVGSFLELDLSKYFQSDAIIPAQSAGGKAKGGPAVKGTGKYKLLQAGQGLSVGDIPENFAPDTGTWQVPIHYDNHVLQVPFLMPAGGLGVKDALDIQKQLTLSVPTGKYLGVWFLELGINGGGTAQMGAVFAGGVNRQYTMYFQPDCNITTLLPPQFLIYAAPYFLTPTGVNQGCRYLFADAVPINPHLNLTKILIPATTFEQTNHMVIMAITLQKA